MLVMASNFYNIGASTTGSTGLYFNSQIKSLKNHFCVRLYVCTMITDRAKNKFNFFACRMCLLWSLYFRCFYHKVKVMRKVIEVDAETFRNHTSEIILHSKELKIMSSRPLHAI